MTGPHVAEVRLQYATAVRALLARGATLPEARAAVTEEMSGQLGLRFAFLVDGAEHAGGVLAEVGRAAGRAFAALSGDDAKDLADGYALAGGGRS